MDNLASWAAGFYTIGLVWSVLFAVTVAEDKRLVHGLAASGIWTACYFGILVAFKIAFYVFRWFLPLVFGA